MSTIIAQGRTPEIPQAPSINGWAACGAYLLA